MAIVGFGTTSLRAQKAYDDGLDLIEQTSRRYAEAKTLHLEEVMTNVSAMPMFTSTGKWEVKVYRAPGGRLRLESSNSLGSALVVADGTKEWVLHRSFDEYTEQAAGAFAMQTRPNRGDESGENEAWATRNPLGTLPERLFSAHRIADETITYEGVATECSVVHVGSSDLLNPAPDRSLDETIWIGKKSGLVVRIKLHDTQKLRVGTAMPAHPVVRTTDTLREFPVDEIGMDLPDSLFHFDPPAGAKRVVKFTDTGSVAAGTGAVAVPQTPMGTNAVGSRPPAVSLLSQSGEKVALKDFHGKPVLIDFWATWCGPCKSTMPALKKIREKTRELGLAMVGIDSDEDAAKGPAFYRDKKFDWPDYHQTGAVARAFPHSAIPTTVLLDGEGKVVYFHTGANEKGLVKAIASLGPEYEGAMKRF